MYGTLNGSRKRRNRDNCRYLLTSSSTWILNEAVPTTSTSLIVSYNDTIQFEHTVIKEELDTENIEGVSFGSFLLSNGAENKSAVEVDKDAEAEDTLYIKFEEDCDKGNEVDHKGNDSLIETEDEGKSAGTELKDNGKGDTTKYVNEKLTIEKSFSSVYGRIKTVDGEVHYECDFCTKLFKYRHHIAKHRRSHTKEKVKCDRCTKSFTSLSGLQRHINTIHNGLKYTAKCTNGKVKCDNCNKTYSSLESVKSHFCKMFKCDKCTETFSTLDTLQRHTCGTFKCSMCNKAYITLHSLKCHVCKSLTSKEQVRKCEKCDKVFPNEARLHRHVNFGCYYTAIEALKTSKLGNDMADK